MIFLEEKNVPLQANDVLDFRFIYLSLELLKIRHQSIYYPVECNIMISSLLALLIFISYTLIVGSEICMFSQQLLFVSILAGDK